MYKFRAGLTHLSHSSVVLYSANVGIAVDNRKDQNENPKEEAVTTTEKRTFFGGNVIVAMSEDDISVEQRSSKRFFGDLSP